MIKYIECPTCHKKCVRVDVSSDSYEVITTGRPLSEFRCQARCKNCYRRIKYAVERIKDDTDEQKEYIRDENKSSILDSGD